MAAVCNQCYTQKALLGHHVCGNCYRKEANTCACNVPRRMLTDFEYGPYCPMCGGWVEKYTTPDKEAVNHPKHYNKHPSGVECIQITEHMSFPLGNVIKYIWRADEKNGIEDLEKALWYLKREIERRKKEKNGRA